MGSPENLGTNGGILPPSLLESASLGAALDDNSALTSLQIALRKPSGSDPITSKLKHQEKSPNTTENNKSNQDTTNYTPLGNNIFDSGQSFKQPQNFTTTPIVPISNNNQNSNKTKGKDSLTGNTTDNSLVGITEQKPLIAIGALGNLDNSQQNSSVSSSSARTSSVSTLSTSQTSTPSFAIRTEGTISINSNGDFDGIPTDLSDDALIYAAKGFVMNGNLELPVQRDAQGNPIRDTNGKLVLVDKAVAVSNGYTTSIANGSNSKYAGLVPPPVIAQQTVFVPAYTDIRQVDLNRRIPAGTPTVTFNISQNPLNTSSDWSQKFPPAGTVNNPTVVRVIGGGLNIPANVNLSNYVITVEQGDINFNGNNYNLNNVALVTNNGNINLANVLSRDLSVFASGSINMNSGARFAGDSMLATGSSSGNITFNGATASTNSSDNLKVISQGDITYNGASDTRGLFLNVKNFTFNGISTLYGSISAKGNIIFNGQATVIAVAELMPDITPPIISATLARDTAPKGQTNQDKITFDPTITGTVTDTNPIVEFRAGFNSTTTANYTSVMQGRNSDGSFSFTRSQLETIYGGILSDGVYTLHLQAKDLYGNLSNTFDVQFTLDTTTVSPNNLDLLTVDDSGVSNTDNLTNKNTPHITGNAEAGAVVQLFNNGQLLGQATANNTGAWQIVTNSLTDGTYNLTARSTDIAGNVSNLSTGLSVTIDSTLPILTLNTPVDTAPLTPGARLTGSVDGTGSTVTALSYHFDNLASVTIPFNATGAFDQSLDLTGLANGAHTLTITATDTAGNIKTTQYPVTVVIDQTAPVINASLLHDTAPNGQTNSDGITFDPTITGTVIDVSRVVEFKAGFDNTLAGNFTNVTGFRNADGNFTFDRSQLETIYGGTLPDGFHTLHLQAVDEFHNTSNIFDFSFTFDSTTSEPVFNINAVSDSGVVGDFQTKFSTVTLTGLAEANSTVVLEQTGAVTTSDNNGQFTFAHVSLAIGDNSFIARSTDIAGNQNTYSTSIYRLSPPTAINLIGNTVAENSSTGTVIGQLSSIDPDTGDTHTYTLEDNADGRFRIVGNQLQVADGTLLNFESSTQHSVTVSSTDANGLSLTQVFAIAVTNVNEAPSFTSTPISKVESGNLYTYNIVATDPDAGDSLRITTDNLPSWLTLVDNLDGTATLRGTPKNFLDNINSNIHLKVTDASGLTAIQDFTIAPTTSFTENNNFAVSRSLSLTIPATPSILSFKITPGFDTTAVNSINDAIDVALVDANGNSLVHTVGSGRDAFFNWTEGESTALGVGTSYDAATGTVSLNLTGITPGTNAQLVFRLVNDDGDVTTSVRITDFALTKAPDGTQAPVQTDFDKPISQTIAPNFNLLTDISSSIGTEYHRTSFNADTHLLYADIALRNIGSKSVDSPLIVAVNHISDPTVLVRNPDGFTPDGLPYYDFSKLVGDTKFDSNELTLGRTFVFYNPQGVQFTYDLTVLAQLNTAPVIQTQPNKEVIAGHNYTYDVDATDPNGDSLTYKLLVAPDGMTIDQTTGLIAWNTAANSTGNSSVLVEVSDGRGGIGQQQYSLSVIDALPNRPPIFTSTPIVDAAINTPYIYQANASDADDDSLTFSLLSAPAGMKVDANTGVVSWTPNGTQLGTYEIKLAVTDGKGGIAQQAFQVQTQAESGNHAPLIISDPINKGYVSKLYNYDVNALDPDNDSLTYSLAQAPKGMTIDANTGIISWSIPVVGQQDVTVQVQDNRGGVDTQSFKLNVSDIVPGQITGKVYLDNAGPKEQLVYFDNFENPTKTLSEWSNPKRAVTPRGQRNFLGRYIKDGQGGAKTSLTLTDLPEHDKMTLSFKLFVIESWDGNANWLGGPPHTWDLIVRDGPTLLHTNFLNVDFYWSSFGVGQAYPNNYPDSYPNIPRNTNNPPRTGASEVNTLGYSFYGDSVYDLTFTFEHSGNNLILDFSGENPLSSWDNDSWGLDDIEIRTISQGKGLANVPVYLDSNNNGQRDGDEEFTRTDNQGNYSFNVAAGNYTVVQELQPAWSLTTPTIGNYQVTVSNNQVIKGLDFGNVIGSAINSAPAFLNQPTTTAMAGQKFRYKPIASDPNGDPLSYSLKIKPDSMVVDPATGLISWVPTANDLGFHDVILSVADGRGEQTLQSFQVKVDPFNSLPVFLSGPGFGLPTGPIAVRQTYSYQPRTQDPDGDPISYSLTAAPDNAYIDSQTGLLTWTPTDGQTGQQSFAITINDGRGGKTTQSFEIQVLEAENTPLNQNPVISSSPRTEMALGQNYFYAVQVSDPNGDPLTYSLEIAPQGMMIDNQGRIFWQPQATHPNINPVTIRVSDGRGGSTSQTFDIQIVSFATRTNNAPSITSTPNLVTNLERTYAYNLSGSDLNNDLLVWSLDSSPAGMVIDPQSGALRWQPKADQIGEHTVVVRLTDAYGLYVAQEFTLHVTGVNTPSAIVSYPITRAAQNQLYTYTVVATDPENDPLTFSLGTKPAGMTIDNDGTIRWTPQASQIGSQQVEVFARDTQGAVTTQTYAIEVGATAINTAPSITSTPVYLAAVGSPYSYQVQATDPDAGDRLTYQLLSVPAGVTGITIDPTTGLLTWTNPVAGNYKIVVGAVDAAGLGAAQGFTLTARVNNAPVIQSNPKLTATPGSTYSYDVIATDVDGDRLTYTLDQASRNLGMTLDTLGRLRWTPTAGNVGSHTVVITVNDANGSTGQQQYNLSVAADTEAPKVRLIANYDSVNLGESITFQALATDNTKVAGLQLLINGTAVVLDSNGMARFTPTTAGTITAKAIATDTAGNIGEATFNVAVIDTSDVNASDVSLNLGAYAGGLITAPVDIKGSISDDGSLDYYRLLVAPVAGGEFREIAFVDNPTAIADGVLGKFDPSLLQNDSYILRLEVADNGGHISYADEVVDVAGDLKLGNFRLSFTDLTVPVTGIPITLTRTYDSLNSGSTDDFGYGWRMEFRDTDLRTSLRTPSEEEQLLGYQSAFKDGTKVYITLPGGQREAFTFKPTLDPIFNLAASFAGTSEAAVYRPKFVGDKSVTSTLTVKDARILHKAGSNEYVGLNGGLNYNPADVNFGSVYVLTTKEGIVYEIDAATGDLLTVTDNNGNKLTYTDADITSSTGQKITFGRDAQGRIATVTDPAGKQIRYDYNAQGDLVSVTDREGNTTQMEYDQERKHYLDKIIDPLGRTGVKAEYDEVTGRLKEIVDVNGQKVEMTYDPNNSRQTVLDQLGHATVYEYDARGNILTEIDAEGQITKRTYDDNNYVLEETVISDRSGPNGFTTKYTYDSLGNKLTEEDPLHNVTIYTYGANSRLLTETDALGRTTTNVYSRSGNLRSTTDALGHTTGYDYDLRGQLRSVKDANGNVTTFDYDNNGNVTSITDALNNVTVYTYNANGDKLTETRQMTTPTGLRALLTTWTYDDEGRVKTMTDAENHTTTYEYDKLGHQTAIVDALQHRTEYKYDDKGQLVATIYADNTPDNPDDNLRETSRYDQAGRTIATIDKAGRETRFVYDDVGRLIETLNPDSTPNNWDDNTKTRTEYYSDGLVKAQIDERDNRTEFRYDAVGRQNQVIYTDDTPATLTDNPRTTYTYDKAGQRISQTDALNHTTSYKYDDLGRLSKTEFNDKTFTTTEYDNLGRRIAMTDQNGKRTEYRYDVLGRLTGVKNALQDWTEYSYNQVGNLISQTDANQHTTRYEYDGVGRRTATILPMTQRADMTYDAVGNLKTYTDFNRNTTTYKYNPMNWITSKQFQDESKVTYTYTPVGLQDVITFVDANGQTTATYDYDYDERDRLTKRTDPDGRKIEYTYDAASNRTSVTTASGIVNYTFDVRNRLDQVIENGVITADYDYDAVSNLVRTTLANGTQEIRSYDDLNRLKYLENHKGDTILSSYSYTLDKVGNRTKVVEQDGRTVDYIYDDLYRLTEEKITDAINGNRLYGYTYDQVGNRKTKSETVNSAMTVTDYAYDANDRLLNEKVNQQVVANYTYDNNGNTLTKTENSIITEYTWNYENRLIAAILKDANGAIRQAMQYGYNDKGIRVTSTVSGVETRYLIDEMQPYAQVLEEYSSDGAVQVEYVYGNDLIAQEKGSDRTFYHVDGLGSTRVLTNSTGSAVSTYDYEAYGELISSTGGVDNKYLFAGEQFDEALGDYYNRARYYDVETGRFTRRDDFEGRQEDPLTLHKYIYAHNNPVNCVDPTGLFTIAEISAANTIRNILAGIQTDAGGHLIASTANGGDYTQKDIILSMAIGLGLIATPIAISFLRRGLKVKNLTLSNTLPDALPNELAAATRLKVQPFKAGTRVFDNAIDTGDILKWVVTENGELFFIPKTINGQEIYHSVITKGQPVLAAGEASIAGGGGQYFVTQLTNHSGHYLPNRASIDIAKAAFKVNGLHVSNNVIDLI